MLQRIRRAESPAGNGMVILQDTPFDPNGNLTDATLCSQLVILPTVVGQFGQVAAVTPGRLSRAGLVAMMAALNTYIAGLSAGNADLINNQLAGGLQVHCTPTLVQVGLAPAGAAAAATALAAVLSGGGNVIALPAFN